MRQPAGKAEDVHARADGCPDAVHAVLDDHAALRDDPHCRGSVQEEVGCGLSTGNLGGTEDPPVEPRRQTGDAQGSSDPLVGAAGGHAGRDASGGKVVEDVDNSRHRAQLGLERGMHLAGAELVVPRGNLGAQAIGDLGELVRR